MSRTDDRRSLGALGLAGIVIPALLSAWVVAISGCASGAQMMDDTSSPIPASSSTVGEAESFGPGGDLPPSPKTIEALARVLSAQKRDGEAEYVLSRVLREHPKHMSAYNEMAELHLRNRRVDDALRVLSEGLMVAPDDPVLLNNLGMCQMLKGDHQAALATFSLAAGIVPEDARYRGNMAAALGMLGRYDEALALYAQIVPPADAHHNLAVICDARNDPQRANSERNAAKELRNGRGG